MSRIPEPPEFITSPGDYTVDRLTAEMAGWMIRRPEFKALRIAARGEHPTVFNYLVAVSALGDKWCSSQARTPLTNTDEQPTELRSWVTSSEAADLLGGGPRAVQQAIARGRLKATKVNGVWRIEREDLEHYRATRAA
ncbi:helix-turn-helix domain-containing protein [Nocardioides aquiterrae]|uniref:Helix-turn-helix domain-containing protein n=1 Tax=Nocardioides aquiterrae TaxID=203799 RepID=A0ABN1ULU4_9ACTN